MDVKALLRQAVEAAARGLGATDFEVPIQETPPGKPGDYGTPAAFVLAKALRQNPAQVAAQLAASIELPAGIERAEALGPYLNFFVDAGAFVRSVVEGRPEPAPQPGKVVIEHTGVNPNKELHIGHVRNVALGDSMARIFRAAGYRVEVQNYIDDTGRQAAESLFAVRHYGRVWNETDKYDHFMGEGYVRLNADPEKPTFEEGISAVMHRLERGELRADVERIVKAHLETCFRLGARYDLLTWESDIVGSGFLTKAMNILEASPYAHHPQEGKYAGAFVMDVSSFMPGLEESNVVLVRSDGTAMYAAKDIGQQFWKFGLFEGMKFKRFMPNPDGTDIWTSAPDGEADTGKRFAHAYEVINVIDSRQDHPQRVVSAALGVAGHPDEEARSIHLSYAFVTYEGQTISGRKGIGVSADEVMDEAQKRALNVLADINPTLAASGGAAEIARRIGIGALRFTMVRSEPTRTLDFRWDQALALNGDTSVYVQYAAVRAANIRRRVQEAGIQLGEPDWSSITPHELPLAKTVLRLAESVQTAVRVHSPHVVAQYALDLATAFNAWYNAKDPNAKDSEGKRPTNVLTSPPGLREARLALVDRLRETFVETLALLGVEVPEAM